MSRPTTVRAVAEQHLCCGCGVCAYLEPDAITMVDVLDQGRRPLVDPAVPVGNDGFVACPGQGLEHDFDESSPELIQELVRGWGPVLSIWEGYAADDAIRWAGSSAGAATALALHCLEQERFAGVLHIAARQDVPYLNETVFSTTRAELLAATGSRYAPASPCDRLELIEQAAGSCVFIGKPCDVAGAQAARRLRSGLDSRLGLTIAVFCAGTPSTAGTLEMIRELGIEDAKAIREVRYRGNGWPGRATVRLANGEQRSLSYEDSWGRILQRHRQWRCRVCADHTGEFADVAVGDPWYRELAEGEPGQSLIVARSPRGRQIVEAAVSAGTLVAQPVSHELLPRSQPNLLKSRGMLWAQVLTSRLMGIAAPRYRNLPTFPFWLRQLTVREKVGSFTGTAKRIVRKRLRHPALVEPYEPRDS